MSEPAGQSVSERRETVRTETAQVRRSPKYSVFIALGVALGIIVALLLTFVFGGTDEASRYTNVSYGQIQVFGFLALWCIPAGIIVLGGIALILDRIVGRRTRTVTVDHTHSPAITDED